MAPSSLAEHVARGRERLVAAGIRPDEARFDAELIARHVLGWDSARWLASRREPAPEPFVARYGALVERRATREPIALITGTREFWGLELATAPGVLIPRPETELLVEEALGDLAATAAPRIADVGTGTGCIAVALARELPGARVVATDLSAAALEIARRNVTRHGVADRVHLVRTSCLGGVRGPFDAIASNPPYVRSGDRPGLSPEVRDHEPPLALDGGADGLEVIRVLFAQAERTLAPDGRLIVEFGYGQEEHVREAAREAGLEVLRIRADLQGIERVAVIRRA